MADSRDDQDLIGASGAGKYAKLAGGEVLLEGAYTFTRFRGVGAMADGMWQLLAMARRDGARCAFTYVADDNIPSLRGCANVGFVADHVHFSVRRLVATNGDPRSRRPRRGRLGRGQPLRVPASQCWRLRVTTRSAVGSGDHPRVYMCGGRPASSSASVLPAETPVLPLEEALASSLDPASTRSIDSRMGARVVSVGREDCVYGDDVDDAVYSRAYCGHTKREAPLTEIVAVPPNKRSRRSSQRSGAAPATSYPRGPENGQSLLLDRAAICSRVGRKGPSPATTTSTPTSPVVASISVSHCYLCHEPPDAYDRRAACRGARDRRQNQHSRSREVRGRCNGHVGECAPRAVAAGNRVQLPHPIGHRPDDRGNA